MNLLVLVLMVRMSQVLLELGVQNLKPKEWHLT